MDQLDIKHLPELLKLTYRVLAMRSLLYLALALTAGAFAASLAIGSWLSLATAGAFAALVFLPVLYRCARKEDPDGQSS